MSPTLNVKTAAEVLQVHPNTVEKLIASCQIPAARVCQDWIDDHSKADNCTYNDCDMVAAVTDVRTAILQLQHKNGGSA